MVTRQILLFLSACCFVVVGVLQAESSRSTLQLVLPFVAAALFVVAAFVRRGAVAGFGCCASNSSRAKNFMWMGLLFIILSGFWTITGNIVIGVIWWWA